MSTKKPFSELEFLVQVFIVIMLILGFIFVVMMGSIMIWVILSVWEVIGTLLEGK